MARPLFRSFAGVEITPEMHGRIDLTKYQTGVSLALNFLALPHGPMARRPGFGYIQSSHNSALQVRLIPFVYSSSQAVVIELGHLYARFHTSSGSVLDTAKTITSIVGNTVNITSHGYAVGEMLFIGTRYFRVATVVNANSITVSDLYGVAATPSGTTAARVYIVTTPYTSTDLFGLTFAQDSDVLTICHPNYAARELRRLGATNWQLTAVSFAPSLLAPGGMSATASGAGGTPSTYEYVTTSLAADGVTESLPSASVSASVDLSVSGNKITVAWSAATGAARYYVYKKRGGSFGYIGQATGLNFVDDNILPDFTKPPPESIITLNGGANDYPATVTHHEQRRWFAGTKNKPQSIFATRNGTLSNLTSGIPSRDDDAMEFRIAATQQNAIKHMLPLSDIIVLTTGGEWRIFSSNDGAIAPTNLMAKPQGFNGCSDTRPVLTNGSVLYVQAMGSRINELSYNWESQSYRSIDLSVMAPHLFDGYTIVDLAYSRAPDQVVWAVRSDGTLLSMTYVPNQSVFAWARHTTDGVFESVCVIPDGREDAVFVLVRRTINGQTVRCIERLRDRTFAAAADAFFVDSGLTYSGAPASTITGLWHLEGRQVDILADGAVETRKTVTNGAVTLSQPASKVHVGLPFTSDFRTLPVILEATAAFGQGMSKNVSKAFIKVYRSSMVKAGPNFNELSAFPERLVSTPYDSPPPLTDDELEITVAPDWGRFAQVCVRQDLPVPLTITSMVLEVATGG
jgi:hypothetical protein